MILAEKFLVLSDSFDVAIGSYHLSYTDNGVVIFGMSEYSISQGTKIILPARTKPANNRKLNCLFYHLLSGEMSLGGRYGSPDCLNMRRKFS